MMSDGSKKIGLGRSEPISVHTLECSRCGVTDRAFFWHPLEFHLLQPSHLAATHVLCPQDLSSVGRCGVWLTPRFRILTSMSEISKAPLSNVRADRVAP